MWYGRLIFPDGSVRELLPQESEERILHYLHVNLKDIYGVINLPETLKESERHNRFGFNVAKGAGDYNTDGIGEGWTIRVHQNYFLAENRWYLEKGLLPYYVLEIQWWTNDVEY